MTDLIPFIIIGVLVCYLVIEPLHSRIVRACFTVGVAAFLVLDLVSAVIYTQWANSFLGNLGVLFTFEGSGGGHLITYVLIDAVILMSWITHNAFKAVLYGGLFASLHEIVDFAGVFVVHPVWFSVVVSNWENLALYGCIIGLYLFKKYPVWKGLLSWFGAYAVFELILIIFGTIFHGNFKVWPLAMLDESLWGFLAFGFCYGAIQK